MGAEIYPKKNYLLKGYERELAYNCVSKFRNSIVAKRKEEYIRPLSIVKPSWSGRSLCSCGGQRGGL